jgi:hypothetical protein
MRVGQSQWGYLFVSALFLFGVIMDKEKEDGSIGGGMYCR